MAKTSGSNPRLEGVGGEEKKNTVVVVMEDAASIRTNILLTYSGERSR